MQKLILGCGPRHVKLEDEVLVDIRPFPNVDIVWDLNKPWEFAKDRSFVHASAVHVVEHLDSLLHFMDEAWRVLIPGGSLYIETPLAGGDVDLEWADPTHKRCYRIHSFVNYFGPEGVERFGYTDKAWNLFHLAVRDSVLVLHAYPMKQ